MQEAELNNMFLLIKTKKEEKKTKNEENKGKNGENKGKSAENKRKNTENKREMNVRLNTCRTFRRPSPSGRTKFCTRTALTTIFGLFVLLFGFLLAFGHYSLQKTTTSTRHVEGHIPTYLTAGLMMLAGLLAIIASRRRVKYLVTCVVFLSIICTMFCFVSFVYLLADVNSDLSKLQDCTFSIRDKTCRCYVSDRAGRRLLKFSAVQSCLSVRKNLRSLVYGVSVLFGVGFIISMVTAIASSYLLYAEQRKSIQQRSILTAESPIQMTSITTQTQESCLQTRPPPVVTTEVETQGACARNLSVGTQTPIYMMPVAQLVYDINSDSQREYRMLNVTSNDRDEPPPPYCDAITST